MLSIRLQSRKCKFLDLFLKKNTILIKIDKEDRFKNVVDTVDEKYRTILRNKYDLYAKFKNENFRNDTKIEFGIKDGFNKDIVSFNKNWEKDTKIYPEIHKMIKESEHLELYIPIPKKGFPYLKLGITENNYSISHNTNDIIYF